MLPTEEEEQHPASTRQTVLEEMKPLCGLSLEHNPLLGFGCQQGGEVGGGGGVREELERIYFFVGIVRFRLPLSEPGHWNLCVTRDPPPLSSPHRVRLGALSERLPVGGRSLRGRGRGQRQPPSQQPPPSRCARGPCRNVRGG